MSSNGLTKVWDEWNKGRQQPIQSVSSSSEYYAAVNSPFASPSWSPHGVSSSTPQKSPIPLSNTLVASWERDKHLHSQHKTQNSAASFAAVIPFYSPSLTPRSASKAPKITSPIRRAPSENEVQEKLQQIGMSTISPSKERPRHPFGTTTNAYSIRNRFENPSHQSEESLMHARVNISPSTSPVILPMKILAHRPIDDLPIPPDADADSNASALSPPLPSSPLSLSSPVVSLNHSSASGNGQEVLWGSAPAPSPKPSKNIQNQSMPDNIQPSVSKPDSNDNGNVIDDSIEPLLLPPSSAPIPAPAPAPALVSIPSSASSFMPISSPNVIVNSHSVHVDPIPLPSSAPVSSASSLPSPPVKIAPISLPSPPPPSRAPQPVSQSFSSPVTPSQASPVLHVQKKLSPVAAPSFPNSFSSFAPKQQQSQPQQIQQQPQAVSKPVAKPNAQPQSQKQQQPQPRQSRASSLLDSVVSISASLPSLDSPSATQLSAAVAMKKRPNLSASSASSSRVCSPSPSPQLHQSHASKFSFVYTGLPSAVSAAKEKERDLLNSSAAMSRSQLLISQIQQAGAADQKPQGNSSSFASLMRKLEQARVADYESMLKEKSLKPIILLKTEV